jgi:Uma2 family endonuclease
MSTATVTPPPGASTERSGTSATAEAFGITYAGDHVEFVDGQVKEVPMLGGRHGQVCFRLAFALGQFVQANDLGHIFINDTFVKVPTRYDPERVYGADVCFVSYDRLPKGSTIPAGILPVTPNLVVEIRSPSDTWTQVFTEVVDYLGAGVPVAVLVDPTSLTVSVYGDAIGQRVLGANDVLTLPEVLPNFSSPVAAPFA